jgi:alpha-beta hydrolase superfamily lysophospholipase
LTSADADIFRTAALGFSAGGYRLAASLDVPAGAPSGARLPAVLFCHGYTGNRVEAKRLFVLLARRLSARGIASLRFDHRGCGESDGDFLDFTAAGLIEDVEAAVETFVALDCVDSSRVAVVGYSLGGVGAACALRRFGAFRTAVLWAPVARPVIIHARLARTAQYEGWRERGYVDDRGTRVSAGYLAHCEERLTPLAWVKDFAGPILFLHGTEDTVVAPEHTREYVAARAHPGDEAVMLEGADHAFAGYDHIAMLLTRSEQWLSARLLGD